MFSDVLIKGLSCGQIGFFSALKVERLLHCSHIRVVRVTGSITAARTHRFVIERYHRSLDDF